MPGQVRHQGLDNVPVDLEGRGRCGLGIPGAESRIVLFTPDGTEDRIGSMSNVTFMADDVEATYEELTARGVEFTSPPESMPWGTFAVFKDPEGNTFVLSSP